MNTVVAAAATILLLASAQANAQTNTAGADAAAQTNAAGAQTPPQAQPTGSAAPKAPARPEINWFYRSQEEWSVLADPALRTDPFDPIKYIRLGSDAQTYLSLGLTIRERFESTGFILRPVVVQPENYLFDRVQLHADLHLGPHVRVFTQLIDARGPWKAVLGPVDQDRLDLEQAFLEISVPARDGGLNITVGRKEPFFDMQRFIAIQEGPNVWQPFDSVEVRYTHTDWLATALYARPVLTRDVHPFDDTSINGFTLSGARLERLNVGRGKLSFFAAELRNDDARYLTATGHERRHVIEAHYAGRAAGWDWDAEGMGQLGSVRNKTIRAWGSGALFGYTWESWPLSPRLGFQFDAASGTNDPKGDVLGTFNPLFPNGFYEMLSGYPGYANFVQLRLPATVHPTRKLSTLLDVGSLWRMTTADAVYFLPAIPVLGTAGHGGAYSGTYGQIRLDWKISRHLTGALDNEYFAHSQSLQQTGARNGHYIGIELNFGI